jgi:hypothetical protein
LGEPINIFPARQQEIYRGCFLALYSKATFHQPKRSVLSNGLACSKFREHATRYSWRTPSTLAECNIFNTNHSLNETRRKKLQMCTRIGCGIGCQDVTIRRGIRRRWDVVAIVFVVATWWRPEALPGGPGRLDSTYYFFLCL